MERSKVSKVYLQYIMELARRSTEVIYRSMLSRSIEVDVVPPFPPAVVFGVVKAKFPIAVVHEYPSGQLLIVVPVNVRRNRSRVLITYKIYEIRNGAVFEDDAEVESEFVNKEYAELFARRLRRYARMFRSGYAS